MPFRGLVVDDNQRFLAAARHSLERQGLGAVDTALNIDSALEAVATGRPDVVLVDVSLGRRAVSTWCIRWPSGSRT